VGQPISLSPVFFEAGGAGSVSLVTPAQARAVATAMWPTLERVLISSDTRALSQLLPPGPMLSGLIRRCAVAQPSCVLETTPRPIVDLQTVVPLQRSYPIYFLAEVTTTSFVQQANGLNGKQQQPWIELQVMTKASAHASWKVSFDTGYDGAIGAPPTPLPFEEAPSAPAGGQDLYNVVPRNTPPVPASRYLPLLAAYWQGYKATGHAPAGAVFGGGGYAPVVGQELAAGRQGSIYLGYRRKYTLTVDRAAGQWEFATAGSYPMICGSIRDTETDTPLKGALLQNPDETNWGVPLPPGEYRQISDATDHQTCVFVTQAGLATVANNTYAPTVTGKKISNLRPQVVAHVSATLGDLETAYGVLAAQFLAYGKTLAACEQAHPQAASCLTSYARKAGQQLAQFDRSLTSMDHFPARVSPQVASLSATTRELVSLFGQIKSARPPAATIAKIDAGEKTLGKKYAALAKALS
jgi:hypothetical protein